MKGRLSVTNLRVKVKKCIYKAEKVTGCMTYFGIIVVKVKKCSHFCPDDDWSIQLKRQQVILRAQVHNR